MQPRPPDLEVRRPWHALPATEALAVVESDDDRGLTADEARSRLERHGPNALPAPELRSLVSVFLGQFKSPLIYLLFVAAGLALVMPFGLEEVVILGAVASLVLWVEELRKLVVRRRDRARTRGASP